MFYSKITDYRLLITDYQALIALVAALLPTYLIRFSVLGIPTNVLEGAIGLLFFLGLSQVEVRNQWQQAWRSFPQPLVWLIGLFLLASISSTITSPHPYTSLGILKGWIIVPMIFGWVVYASKPKGITNYELRITNSLIFSGVVVALLGISQIGTLDRVQSIYDVPNSLALFLAPLIVMATWLSIRPKVKHYHLPPTTYNLYFYAALIMFLALLATQSLAGIGAVIISLVIGILLTSKKSTTYFVPPKPQAKEGSLKPIPLLIIALLVVLTLFINAKKINYLAQPNSSLAVRLQLWSVSWDIIKEHPILGIGLGTFEPAYQAKLHERFQEFENCGIGNSLKIENCKLKIQTRPLPEFVFRDPHNWLLSFWLNTGLLGLLSFIAIHFWVIKKTLLQPNTYNLQPMVLALLTLLLYGLADTIYWKNDLAVLHWTLFALLISAIAPLAMKDLEHRL